MILNFFKAFLFNIDLNKDPPEQTADEALVDDGDIQYDQVETDGHVEDEFVPEALYNCLSLAFHNWIHCLKE